MDGGGRLAGSLNEMPPRLGEAAAAATVSRRRALKHRSGGWRRSRSWPPAAWRRYERFLDRIAGRLTRLPRPAGRAAVIFLFIASAGYGAVRSGRAGDVSECIRGIRDSAAMAA